MNVQVGCCSFFLFLPPYSCVNLFSVAFLVSVFYHHCSAWWWLCVSNVGALFKCATWCWLCAIWGVCNLGLFAVPSFLFPFPSVDAVPCLEPCSKPQSFTSQCEEQAQQTGKEASKKTCQHSSPRSSAYKMDYSAVVTVVNTFVLVLAVYPS